MKNYSKQEDTPKGNIWELRYHKEQPMIINFGLMAGVKDEYRFPSFDEMLTDLQKNESDLNIYQQLENYSKLLNRVKL